MLLSYLGSRHHRLCFHLPWLPSSSSQEVDTVDREREEVVSMERWIIGVDVSHTSLLVLVDCLMVGVVVLVVRGCSKKCKRQEEGVGLCQGSIAAMKTHNNNTLLLLLN